jgi:hypothetical protein
MRLIVVAGVLALGAANATLIDVFEDDQALLGAGTGTGSGCGNSLAVGVGTTNCTSSTLSILTGLGSADREMFVDFDSGGVGTTRTTGEVVSGVFANERTSSVNAQAEMQYALDSSVLFSSFLSGLSLEVISSDAAGGVLYFYVNDGSSTYYSPGVAIPGAPGTVTSLFSSWFSTPLSGDSIAAFGFYINDNDESAGITGQTSRDYQFDNFSTYVPEPGTYVLMGLGFAALGLMRRKK